MTIDEAIKHARKVAKEHYIQGFLCHANPDDEELGFFVNCGQEHEQLAKWLEELETYKEAEKQGLLVKLPCKVGDKFYFIGQKAINGELKGHFTVETGSVSSFEILGKSIVIYDSFGLDHEVETIFTTRKEAEQKLREMEE